MKKKRLPFLILFFITLCSTTLNICFAQRFEHIDLILQKLPQAKEDTNKVKLYAALIADYSLVNPDEGLKYETEALRLAEKLNWKKGIAQIKLYIGRVYWRKGRFQEALNYHFDALKLNEELGNKMAIIITTSQIGQDYADGANYPEALKYFNKTLALYKEAGDKKGMSMTYVLIAWVFENQGLFGEASKNNFEAAKISESIGDKYGMSSPMANLANNFLELGNFQEALKYFQQTEAPLRAAGDMINLSDNYNCIGKTYKKMGNYSAAIENHSKALETAKSINNNSFIGDAYAGLADVYEAQGDLDNTLSNCLLAAAAYRSVSNKILLQRIYTRIGSCYTKQKKFNTARNYFDEAFVLGKEQDSKVAFANYYGTVEVLDSTMGHWRNAYFNYKNYITNRDIIYNQESVRKQTQTTMQYEFDRKEAVTEAEQEKKDISQRMIRNSIAGGFIGSLIFLIIVYRQRNKISKEKKRSEELLLNILPAETAEELKNTNTTVAKDFEQVTVMFTDFKNFTAISEKLSAQELVNEINYYYSAFDRIITLHGIEKIKTIGDSYMCVGGLPVSNKTNAEDTVQAALKIRDFMESEKQRRIAAGISYFEIRIGCNTGPVVAGVVGIKKFAYDIWGDTVNIAAKMEASGEAGKVNISGTTYELVKTKFRCQHRGKVEAKNKGLIDMYFVDN